MNIDSMTIGDFKKLSALLKGQQDNNIDNYFLGKKVIIRTCSAGVWFGELKEKEGTEVILKNARRLWRWQTKKGISLSEIAVYGVNDKNSKICISVETQWLDAIEIILCKEDAITSIEQAKNYEN